MSKRPRENDNKSGSAAGALATFRVLVKQALSIDVSKTEDLDIQGVPCRIAIRPAHNDLATQRKLGGATLAVEFRKAADYDLIAAARDGFELIEDFLSDNHGRIGNDVRPIRDRPSRETPRWRQGRLRLRPIPAAFGPSLARRDNGRQAELGAKAVGTLGRLGERPSAAPGGPQVSLRGRHYGRRRSWKPIRASRLWRSRLRSRQDCRPARKTSRLSVRSVVINTLTSGRRSSVFVRWSIGRPILPKQMRITWRIGN